MRRSQDGKERRNRDVRFRRQRRYENKWSAIDGAEFAIDRACTPSCCLTCKDCNIALSVAMLASTKLPMPVVNVDDSCVTKDDWIENFATPLDREASAASTFVKDDSTVEIIVDAFDWVEIEPVVAIVTILPLRLMFSAATVMRCVPSVEARAVICFVEPLIRLTPLNWAFCTTDVIWPSRAWKFSFNA